MGKALFLFGIFLTALLLVSSVAIAKEDKDDNSDADFSTSSTSASAITLSKYTFSNTTLGVTVYVWAAQKLNVTIKPIIDPTIIDPNRDGTYGGLDKFFDIKADKPFDHAEIRVKYDPAKLKNYVSESSLKLNFWDSAANNWIVPLNAGVNKKKHYVWAVVDHFSTYAPVGNPIGQYSNNFELPRASKTSMPLGVYLKNTFETFNADDLADSPYDVYSQDTAFTLLHSLKFNATIMHPEVFSSDTWLETGAFAVNGSRQYTFTFYTKYLPNKDSTDFGIIYYYELDDANNFLGQTGDLINFNAIEAVSIRDYVTVSSAAAGNGWLKVTATLTTDASATQAKLAFQQYNLNNVGQDVYYLDDFSYA
ncbi:MAG: hypothetical protein HY438_00315 [DPANN group archaeon]|nr:hypothetical protein [DPANN group archaeon]